MIPSKYPISVFLTLLTISLFSFSALAQEENAEDSPYSGISATPKDGVEIGLHGGHFFVAGDVTYDFQYPGYAGGFHIRKALDYVFSVRMDATYGKAFGSSEPNNLAVEYNNVLYRYTYNTTFASLALQGMMTLNNLRWDKPRRKVNYNFIFGVGAAYSTTGMKSIDNGTFNFQDLDLRFPKQGDLPSPMVGFMELGVGASFRISPTFNIALEHKSTMIFDRRSDYLDGFQADLSDVLNYTNLRFNFNLINKGKLSEPLYWVNPLDAVLTDISELKKRPVFDLTDTDEDGVVDILDQDKNSPKGAPVDTRGVPLDSDKDGIADYMDEEPYSPPGVAVDGEGRSQGGYENAVTKDEVANIVRNVLEGGVTTGTVGKGATGVVETFLPMVHFNIDSYTVRYVDYGNLKNLARILNNNPGLQIVVKGYTDKTASDAYNNVLSYRRAQAVVNHLVEQYSVNPSQLVLMYGGESDSLVPSTGSSLMNRRVEFRIAKPEDLSMDPPAGAEIDSKAFQGNKRDGY